MERRIRQGRTKATSAGREGGRERMGRRTQPARRAGGQEGASRREPRRTAHSRSQRRRRQREARRCRFEQLETRELLAVDVLHPMGELVAREDGPDCFIDLRPVFESDWDQTLDYQLVGQGHADLVDASIADGTLRLRHLPEQAGTAEITIRAVGRQDHSSALDTLTLHVTPVNDWPTLLRSLPDINLREGDTTTLDLTSYFQDEEQESGELTYTVTPFEVGYPGNPIAAAEVDDGLLTLRGATDRFGYVQYAVCAVDEEGAQVAATLYVYVDHVNDAPAARPLPDRYHQFVPPSEPTLVALDLWFQNSYDGNMGMYFWDAEDGCYLDYSVTVDNPSVFVEPPWVDEHDFLLYRPTTQPGFQGSAVITITARDREGLVARLPDGSLPSFTVHVHNYYGMDPGFPMGGISAGAGAVGSSIDLGIGLPDGTLGISAPPQVGSSNSSLGSMPVGTDTNLGLSGIAFDLDALNHLVPDDAEEDPGVLVSLNHDFDEYNVGLEAVLVGPAQRPVTVLKALRDNQPNRIPEEGRQHTIAAGWNINWYGGADGNQAWSTSMDDDLRAAVVNASVPGTVSLQSSGNVMLWVPAWALYGFSALSGGAASWQTGTRWIPVREGQEYKLNGGSYVSPVGGFSYALPVIMEGLGEGTSAVIARLTPADGRAPLSDRLNVHVVAVDLDIDSDNNNATRLPDRSLQEEQLEDAARVSGKRLPVNNDDVDHDGVPDFLDGFDLDGLVGGVGRTHVADDQVAVAGATVFTPLVIDLPASIDPARARVRFVYSGSDPAAATISPQGLRHVAPGGLRLWTVDESQRRVPHGVNDPLLPGHYVTPSDGLSGGQNHYSVAQLNGGAATHQFVLYVEGIQAGHYRLTMQVDPDGVASASGQDPLDPNSLCSDHFAGFTLQDSVQITVETEVTVWAVNAIGAETASAQQPDAAAFEISRGAGNHAEGLMVYYRVLYGVPGASAMGPVLDPSRKDYDVVRANALTDGLADDPVTRIGSVYLPSGSSQATITILPCDDREVEWDEKVAIELLEWDEYRQLHDRRGVVTPNDGVPASGDVNAWWEDRAYYRLKRDGQGRPVHSTASVTLLDNDSGQNWSYQQVDASGSRQTADRVEYGALSVDLHGGQAQYELPVTAPRYREDDNLQPLAETRLRLPEDVAQATALRGVYTVAGLPGEQVEFDVGNLAEYLEPNAYRELRLVLSGPDSLAPLLATGYYDHDIQITAQFGDRTLTRTLRGRTAVVNRVDSDMGTPEWGQRWTWDDLDRLVPADGAHSGRDDAAASRLVPRGAAAESGMAVVRGDNSVSWYTATINQPAAVIDVSSIADGRVHLDPPGRWIQDTPADGSPYQTSWAGLQHQEAEVVWSFSQVTAERMVQVLVQWDPASDRASNAAYHVSADPVSGDATTILVDQRYVPGEGSWGGRVWRSLGFFTLPAGSNTLEVRLSTRVDSSTFVDGAVSAGAVMLVDNWDFLAPDGSSSTLEWAAEGGRARLVTKHQDVHLFDAATGCLYETRDPNANRTRYEYGDADGDGRNDELMRVTQQGGLATTVQYEAGFVSAITDFAGRTIQWEIDDGQLQRVTLPDPGYDMEQPVYEFTYDSPRSTLAEVLDPRGQVTVIEHDARTGRVSSVQNPDDYQWTIASYLEQGLDGTIHRPADGRVAATAGSGGELSEPWAVFTDTRGGMWQYQTDRYGWTTAHMPPSLGSASPDVWRWQRDELGLPTRIIEPAGGGGDTPLPAIVTRQEFDEWGNLVRRDHADGTYEQWDYDSKFHQVVRHRDRAGRVVAYALDSRGNVVRKTEYELRYGDTPDRKTLYSYTPRPSQIGQLPGGLMVAETVAAGTGDTVTTRTAYYSSGRQIGLPATVRYAYGNTDPDVAATLRYRYDVHRQLAEQIDVAGQSTLFLYDGLDRLRQQIDPLPGSGDHVAPVTTYWYDAAGNVEAVANPRGAVTHYEYDPMNRLTAQIAPAPGGHPASAQQAPRQAFLYDGEGNRIAQWDAAGYQTGYTYDGRNRCTAQIQPAPGVVVSPAPSGVQHDAPVTRYEYDVWGNLRATRDPLGAITRYQYDAFQQLTRIVAPDPGTGQHAAPVTRILYDAAGQVVEVAESAASGDQVSRYVYDDLGRLRSRWQVAAPGDDVLRLSYTYDLRDNLIVETDSTGRVTTYAYDALNRKILQKLPDPDGAGPLGNPTTRYAYNVTGTLRSESCYDAARPAQHVTTQYSYDHLGRLTCERAPDPDTSGPLLAPEIHYHYDVMGNRVSQTRWIAPGQSATELYRHDNLDRLWSTTVVEDGQALREVVQIHDRLGQVVQQRERVSESGQLADYRYTDFVYDGLGRLITQIDPAATDSGERPATGYCYDAAGNLRWMRDAAGAWTRYDVDALGRLVTIVEPKTDDHAAPVSRMEYTIAGDVSAVVDALGRRTEYEYDSRGQLITQRLLLASGESIWTRYEYDVHGNQVELRDSDGNISRVSYDALDRPVRYVTNGVEIRRGYDSLGRLAEETDPVGATTRYQYDLLGRRTITSPPATDEHQTVNQQQDDDETLRTGVWQLAADGWRGTSRYAVVNSHSAVSATWTFSELNPGATYEVLATWDPDPGNVWDGSVALTTDGHALTDPLTLDQTRIAADVVADDRAWQRLARVTVPGDSLEVEFAASEIPGRLVADGVWLVELSGNAYAVYDAHGNVIAESDALGNITHYTYDTEARCTSVTDANGDTTRFAYDGLGRLRSVVDPLGNATEYEYDRLDRVVEEWVRHDDQDAATRYAYDVKGQLQRVTDRLGRVRSLHYDPLGRLVQEAWYADLADADANRDRLNVIQWSYDVVGRLTEVHDSDSRYGYTYDELDRLVTTVVDIPSAPTLSLRETYTGGDARRDTLRVLINGALDHVNEYEYDHVGRMVSVTQSGQRVADKRVEFEYSAANRLAEVRRYADLAGETLVVGSQYGFDGRGQLMEMEHVRPGQVVATYQWVLDPNGRVVREDSPQDATVRYQYDASGQLISVDHDDEPAELLQYDGNGNRTMSGYEVGDRNQVLADEQFRYEYDAQGNRTRRVELTTGCVTRYRWDVWNRLVAIDELTSENGPLSKSVEYTYDAWGRRIGKAVTTAGDPRVTESFLYDDDDIVLRFQDGQLANRYLHGWLTDQVLADEQTDEQGDSRTVLWPLADRLGSVRDLVAFDHAKDDVTMANHLTYDAFGAVTGETAAAVDHIFGYTGRERDEETDLHYYRARYYDPRLGQFLSEDPAGFAAGDANLRRYVGNDPINRVDPTGMYSEDVHFYFNYYLARYLGLDQPSGWVNSKGQPVSEAYVLAYFATRVDFDRDTRPVAGGVLARSRYHFPDPGGPITGVTRDDPRVRAAMSSVAAAGDLEMFGLLLHVYQDSFAHESYNETIGHAPYPDVDKPYEHEKRDYDMAKRVYQALQELLLARRGVDRKSPEAKQLLRGKDFHDFWVSVDTVFLQPPRNVHGPAALQNRITCWQQLIAKDFNQARPRFNDHEKDATNPLARRFRAVAEKVPVWYRRGYEHQRNWRNWRPVTPDGPPPWNVHEPTPKASRP